MIEAFLICALTLPHDSLSDFNLLRTFLETRYPDKMVVYVAEGEKLIDGTDSRVSIVTKGNSLRVWLVKRAT